MNFIWRRFALPAVLLSVAAYTYFALRGPQGIPALMEKRQQIRQLEEENANLLRENEYKRERIRKLTQSSSEQDLEIRKRLKKLRENETEFILPGGSKATPPEADTGQ